MIKFVHLHTHSHGSLLDGTIKIKDLVARTKELGMTAVAVTDHGTCSQLIQLYKECQKAEIKSILGVEMYLSPTDDHTLREKIEGYPDYYHLTLLAKNEEGVRDLYELSSRAHDEGQYYKPRISFPMVEKFKQNLVVLGACVRGPVAYHLAKDVWGEPSEDDKARVWMERLYNTLGEDFYLEVMDHGLEWQKPLNAKLEALAKEFGVKVVATNDAHFLKREDHYVHSLVMALQMGLTYQAYQEQKSMKYPEECFVKSIDDMRAIFPEEYLSRTMEITEKTSVKLHLDVPTFPEYIS